MQLTHVDFASFFVCYRCTIILGAMSAMCLGNKRPEKNLNDSFRATHYIYCSDYKTAAILLAFSLIIILECGLCCLDRPSFQFIIHTPIRVCSPIVLTRRYVWYGCFFRPLSSLWRNISLCQKCYTPFLTTWM